MELSHRQSAAYASQAQHGCALGVKLVLFCALGKGAGALSVFDLALMSSNCKSTRQLPDSAEISADAQQHQPILLAYNRAIPKPSIAQHVQTKVLAFHV